MLLKVEDLEAQLAESDCRRQELEAQLSTAGYQQQVCPAVKYNRLFGFSYFLVFDILGLSDKNHAVILNDSITLGASQYGS